MRMLVTGLTGRIGFPVLRELRASGWRVRGLLRGAPSDRLSCLLDEVYEGDIRQENTWQEALENVDVVVHLAGVSRNVPEVFSTNVLSTHRMVSVAIARRVKRIVVASSTCVLGHCDRAANLPFDLSYAPVDEEHPLRPEADYALSKHVSEEVLRAASRSGKLEVVALRLAWVWSDRTCEERRTRPFQEARYAPTLWAYVHEEDCAQAFRLALDRPLPNRFEAMFISAADTTADTPSRQLVERYFPQAEAGRLLAGKRESLFSYRKAQQVLGYRPSRSWCDAL